MKVAFLISEYVLHNHIIETLAEKRPHDELLIAKVPLALRGKSRLDSAQTILPKLSRRFIAAKLFEHFGLLVITYLPKIFRQGAVFRRLRVIARRLRAAYFTTIDINSAEAIRRLEEFQPDVIVTLMHQIVRGRLCSISKYGVINIHPGLLPDVRGIQPYFWALSERMNSTGPTIHYIRDETIDTGEILAKAQFDTQGVHSVQLCYYLTMLLAGALLPEVLECLEKTEIKPIPQEMSAGRYYRWPDTFAYNSLWANGCSLLSARDLWALLRGNYDGFQAREKTIYRAAPPRDNSSVT